MFMVCAWAIAQIRNQIAVSKHFTKACDTQKLTRIKNESMLELSQYIYIYIYIYMYIYILFFILYFTIP